MSRTSPQTFFQKCEIVADTQLGVFLGFCGEHGVADDLAPKR